MGSHEAYETFREKLLADSIVSTYFAEFVREVEKEHCRKPISQVAYAVVGLDVWNSMMNVLLSALPEDLVKDSIFYRDEDNNTWDNIAYLVGIPVSVVRELEPNSINIVIPSIKKDFWCFINYKKK